MPRSPWEREHKRQRAANAKMLDIWMSAKHICLCGHVQGFHWDDGVGKCVDAECSCEAFDEDVLAAAQLAAGQLPGGTAERDGTGDDALARAMRADEQREVSDGDAWDRALHSDRPRPIGRPAPSTSQNPAALDALRELGGSPEDLTG